MQLPLVDPVILVIFWCLNCFIASLGAEPLVEVDDSSLSNNAVYVVYFLFQYN
jgi:hypothetical protein